MDIETYNHDGGIVETHVWLFTMIKLYTKFLRMTRILRDILEAGTSMHSVTRYTLLCKLYNDSTTLILRTSDMIGNCSRLLRSTPKEESIAIKFRNDILTYEETALRSLFRSAHELRKFIRKLYNAKY